MRTAASGAEYIRQKRRHEESLPLRRSSRRKNIISSTATPDPAVVLTLPWLYQPSDEVTN
jgi:hypothetical protein